MNNKIPWKLYDDLQLFKFITSHSFVVMGRKTFESIKHPLFKRINVILSTNINFIHNNCIIFNKFSSIIDLSNQFPNQEIFIIGGAEIYKLFIIYVDRLYITKVKSVFTVDTFFPIWYTHMFHRILLVHYYKNEYNDCDFDFEIWERN